MADCAAAAVAAELLASLAFCCGLWGAGAAVVVVGPGVTSRLVLWLAASRAAALARAAWSAAELAASAAPGATMPSAAVLAADLARCAESSAARVSVDTFVAPAK